MLTNSNKSTRGFTLIELLVVIGIIAVLIAIILPSLRKAKLSSQSVVCKSNERQIFTYMLQYANDYKGYMFPVGAGSPYPTTIGTNVMPHQRWPTLLFGMKIPDPLPYPDDLMTYRAAESVGTTSPDQMYTFLQAYDSKPFTPPIMLCPTDIAPLENHSYVVNQHLVQQNNPVRYANGDTGGRSRSDIIVLGEKRSTVRDYHMERGSVPNTRPDPITGQIWPTEFERVVEPYRHGISYGSNYLFLDGHVGTNLPSNALDNIDPWTVTAPVSVPVAPVGP